MEFIENTLGGVLDDLSKHNPNGWAVRYTDRNYFRTWKELNDEADLIARGIGGGGLAAAQLFAYLLNGGGSVRFAEIIGTSATTLSMAMTGKRERDTLLCRMTEFFGIGKEA